MSIFDRILNRPLASIDHEDEYITFKFLDGGEQTYDVVGDCCSRSWIECVEYPVEDVRGLTIVEVKYDPYAYESEDCGELKKYATQFLTSKGCIAVEYRNESNGYYGGDLVLGATVEATRDAAVTRTKSPGGTVYS